MEKGMERRVNGGRVQESTNTLKMKDKKKLSR